VYLIFSIGVLREGYKRFVTGNRSNYREHSIKRIGSDKGMKYYFSLPVPVLQADAGVKVISVFHGFIPHHYDITAFEGSNLRMFSRDGSAYAVAGGECFSVVLRPADRTISDAAISIGSRCFTMIKYNYLFIPGI
jgi:hypothetical protein